MASTTVGVPRSSRVVMISRVKRNPYVDLLCGGLQQCGWTTVVRDQLSLGWMWRARREMGVLHVHWLELLFVYPQLGRSLKRFASVVLALLLARASGVRVAYTVHNVAQHEGQRPRLVALGQWLMLRLANAVHVHDAETSAVLRRRWGRSRGVFVIPHGNYMTCYPNSCSRSEARQRLGLAADVFVYLFLGRVRPYKGIEELLSAYREAQLSGSVLLVAGEVQEPGYERQVQALAGDDPSVQLRLQFVADDELQLYLRGSDVCVLPYRHVTTSGAALLSFSFGTPIVAPRLGCFVELVGANERGLLYEPDDAAGLREALRRVRGRDLAGLRRACLAFAEELDWRTVARQHAAMYQA